MKRWGWRIALSMLTVVELAACGQSPSAVTRLTPIALASPAGSPTPRPAGPTGIFASCRLPVEVPAHDGRALGWLDVATGSYMPDLASVAAVIKERRANIEQAGDLTWDPAVGLWVPTIQSWISPDGTRYISGNLDVVNAATGTVVHHLSTGSLPLFPFAYTNAAIYMYAGGIAAPNGLWRIDAASWKLTQISSAFGNWSAADTSGVWGDGYPGLIKLDVTTGRVTTVYKGNGDQLFIAGLVPSGAIVLDLPNGFGQDGFSSVLIVHPDGTVARFETPPALRLAAVSGTIQDGSALIFNLYYPTDPTGPPASVHQWGLAAFDAEHGVQLVMAKVPDGAGPAGPCMPVRAA